MSYYDDAKYCEVVEADGSDCYQFVNEAEHSYHCPDHAMQDLYCHYCGHDASQGIHAGDCIDPFEYAYEHDAAEPLPATVALWAAAERERRERALAITNNTCYVVGSSYYPLLATSDVAVSNHQEGGLDPPVGLVTP